MCTQAKEARRERTGPTTTSLPQDLTTGYCYTTGRMLDMTGTECGGHSRALPGSLRELPVDLFIHIHIEGPLYEGQGHFQGLDPQWRTPVSNELQPLNAHQAAVAGCILLQVLEGDGGSR